MEAYPLEAAPWMKELVKDDAVAFVGDAAHRKRILTLFLQLVPTIPNNMPWL
jgi:hypothetical protein